MAAIFRHHPNTRVRNWGFVCTHCRQLSNSAPLASGHNRWSKIKHNKGKNDVTTAKRHSALAKELMQASKRWWGPDLKLNPRLADAITSAKQAGFPKSSIEAAIARGQGVTTFGAVLEPVLIEAMLPGSIAMLVDCQTDNKNRTLQHIPAIIKDYAGRVGQTSFMFERKGRLLFEQDEFCLGLEDVMDAAIESGAEDIEVDGEGNIVVYTEPTQTASVATRLERAFALKAKTANNVWVPNKDTMVHLEDESAVKDLIGLLDELQEDPSVHGVALNVGQGRIDKTLWTELQSRYAT